MREFLHLCLWVNDKKRQGFNVGLFFSCFFFLTGNDYSTRVKENFKTFKTIRSLCHCSQSMRTFDHFYSLLRRKVLVFYVTQNLLSAQSLFFFFFFLKWRIKHEQMISCVNT